MESLIQKEIFKNNSNDPFVILKRITTGKNIVNQGLIFLVTRKHIHVNKQILVGWLVGWLVGFFKSYQPL